MPIAFQIEAYLVARGQSGDYRPVARGDPERDLGRSTVELDDYQVKLGFERSKNRGCHCSELRLRPTEANSVDGIFPPRPWAGRRSGDKARSNKNWRESSATENRNRVKGQPLATAAETHRIFIRRQ